MAMLDSLLAPLRAALDPRGFFDWLGEQARRYGPLFTAAFSLGAWLGAAAATFLLVLAVTFARSIVHGDIVGAILSPLDALKASFALPVLAAGVDAALIAVVAAVAPREAPLATVLAVRASSLLPYTLRAALLAVHGELSVASLVAARLSPLDLGLLAAGAAMTAYGLRRSMGMPAAWAAVAAALPLAVKLALALA